MPDNMTPEPFYYQDDNGWCYGYTDARMSTVEAVWVSGPFKIKALARKDYLMRGCHMYFSHMIPICTPPDL
jgi:hypothetical protein